MSIGSTLSTNSVELLYLISNRHQTWYRPKGLPHIIQVQSSQHHPCSFICKFITQIDNMLIKKLHLINPYQVIRFPFQTIYYIGCFTYNKRLYLSSFVRYDMVGLVAIVLLGLKKDNLLFGDHRSFDPTNKLLGFTAKHRSADQLYTTRMIGFFGHSVSKYNFGER